VHAGYTVTASAATLAVERVTAAMLQMDDSSGISEDSLDEAWATAVAAPGQVPQEQWLELIGVREPGHPADVIGPLAIKTLRRLRDDYQRAGDMEGFAMYLDELRHRQRRKTSFVAKLEAAFAMAPD
jgi:hypothetical protein